MNSNKILQQMACLVLVVLFLVGCGVTQAEQTASPMPPTATSTSIPEQTPTASSPQIITTDELIGVYHVVEEGGNAVRVTIFQFN